MSATNDELVNRQLIELEIHMGAIAKLVEKLQEAMDGTLRTRGMRDRVLLAEENIKANRESFEKLDKHIGEAVTDLRAYFDEKLSSVSTEAQAQKTLLTKWQPYMNVIAWLTVGIGGIVLSQVLTGHWRIISP